MYALVGNLDDLETPLLIGLPAGIFLLPTLIYFSAAQGSDWGISSAYTVMFLLLTITLVAIYYRVVVRKAGKFATITGKAYRPRRHRLGRWRWPALGLFFALLLLRGRACRRSSSSGPLCSPPTRCPRWRPSEKLSFDNYAAIPDTPRIANSIWNSVQLGGITATATMMLAFLVAWLVVRQRVRGGLGLDSWRSSRERSRPSRSVSRSWCSTSTRGPVAPDLRDHGHHGPRAHGGVPGVREPRRRTRRCRS